MMAMGTINAAWHAQHENTPELETNTKISCMTKGHAGVPQADSRTFFSRHALPPAGFTRINYNLPR
jgi:hypothetical protein